MKKALLCIIVCLGMALGWALPANAYILTSASKAGITSINTSGSGGTTATQYQAFNGGVTFTLTNVNISSNNLFMALELDTTILEQSLVYVTMSVSGASTGYAPMCFTGSYNRQVIDCDVNGDNGNYTITGVFYMTSAVGSVVLYNHVPVLNLKNATGIRMSVNDVYYSHVSKEFSDTDVNIVKNLLTDIKNGTNTLSTDMKTYMNQESARWVQIKDFLQDSAEAQAETNEKLDREWEQEQDDRDNIEQQSSDVNDAAESSSEDATEAGTTLLAAFSAFVTAITNASPSNCNIDMDLGNLDLGVVNLCQLSLPPALSAIGSILLIAFCVPLSIATATKMIRLFRSFSG